MGLVFGLWLLAIGPVAAETDLSLQAAIDRALDYNFSLQAARADSTAAHDRWRAAAAVRFGVLSLEARSSFLDDVPVANTPIGTLQFSSKESYQADWRLAWPLFAAGRITNTINQERENSRAQTAEVSARRLTTAFDCRQRYLQLLLAQTSVAIAEASLERLDLIRTDVQHLYDNGLADSIDLLEADLARQKGLRQLEGQRTLQLTAEAALYNITGLGHTTPLHLSEPVTPPSLFDSAALHQAEVDRPELARLEHLARSADYSAALARAPYFPALNGFVGYSVGKPNLDMLGRDWNDYWTAGLTLSWEFGIGGREIRSAAAASRRAEAARLNRRELADQLNLQKEAAADELQYAYRVIAIAEREFDLATRRFRMASDKQKTGQLSVNRLLEMEAELTATEQQYRAAVVNYYLAEAQYLYAIGSPRIFGGLR